MKLLVGVGKSILGFVMPKARRLSKERKAGQNPEEVNLDPLDAYFEETLIRLRSQDCEENLIKTAAQYFGGGIIRSELLSNRDVRDWLSEDIPASLLKSVAALRLGRQNTDADAPALKQLRENFPQNISDDEIPADAVIEMIIAVLIAGTDSQLTPGDRINLWTTKAAMESTEEIGNQTLRGYEKLSDQIAEQNESRDLQSALHTTLPTSLIDQQIETEVLTLKKSRFYNGFRSHKFSPNLAKKLTDGELAGGSADVRCAALAWCSRTVVYSDTSLAASILAQAEPLGSCDELVIAQAFLSSAEDDRPASMSRLAELDTPCSRTAAFRIATHHDGDETAIGWLASAQIEFSDMDPDGKLLLLMKLLELRRWSEAEDCIKLIQAEDFNAAPKLHHLSAITKLTSVAPIDFRSAIIIQVPLDAARFPFASDVNAITVRREARAHFLKSAACALELNVPKASAHAQEYALWLELLDPEYFPSGLEKLETMLRDASSALGLVHMGLQFGVKLDLDAINLEVERQIALNGGPTSETAIARFALAFAQKDAKAAANYIEHFRDQFRGHLNNQVVASKELELLAISGQIEKAKGVLSQLVEDGLDKHEENNLRRLIAEHEGEDPIELRKAQFSETDNLADLVNLVDRLSEDGESTEMAKYSGELFERTGALADALRYARALSNLERSGETIKLCQSNPDLSDQSESLRMLCAWAYYVEGDLHSATGELQKVEKDLEDPNYRALQVNLAIASGDWGSLLEFIAASFRERDQRTAQELFGVAQLGVHLEAPNAKELVFAVASKANDDASMLAGLYYLASSAGFEDDEQIHQWLQRAIDLSDEDGPMQKMSLRDVFDKKPEWDRRESETWQEYGRGNMPIFLVGRSLNKSLLDLILFPSLANPEEKDPRSRGIVAAFSGVRTGHSMEIGKVIGIEATALLTLGMLNCLDEVLDAFECVHIPHSTLGWLFEERQRARFHQPSRIKDAREMRDMLATGDLQELIPTALPDGDLAAQVGEELALLIAEAEKEGVEGGHQRLVIQSAPVHRIGSLMEEEADLDSHASALSSCGALVEVLYQAGKITEAEKNHASAYLKLHEQPWPEQPAIESGATLYLDNLAASRLQHIGLLGKLKKNGFEPVISQRSAGEINALLAYEGISNSVTEIVERIRYALFARIQSGKVRLGKQSKSADMEDNTLDQHPTFDILNLAPRCDSIVVDDRYMNQHPRIDMDGDATPILTTLDVIDQLERKKVLTPVKRLELRTTLRRAGYFLVPVAVAELSRHLNASSVQEGKVVESVDLRAVRESILRVRMTSWLQLPKEADWLNSIHKTLSAVLSDQWESGTDVSAIQVRSDWILNQMGIHAWAHCFDGDGGSDMASVGRGLSTLSLLSPKVHLPPDRQREYWTWVEEQVLEPISNSEPELFAWILDRGREQFAQIIEMDFSEDDVS